MAILDSLGEAHVFKQIHKPILGSAKFQGKHRNLGTELPFPIRKPISGL